MHFCKYRYMIPYVKMISRIFRVRFVIQGDEHLVALKHQSCVITPNHQTFLDFLCKPKFRLNKILTQFTQSLLTMKPIIFLKISVQNFYTRMKSLT